MARFRLYPTSGQEVELLEHCAHARYIWNLAVETLDYCRLYRRLMPEPGVLSRQLTEARQEFEWLRRGSVTVQQQALRDFHFALVNWWRGTHGKPQWRKKGLDEGFSIVNGHSIKVEKINSRWSKVFIPKIGWVKFRRTRAVGPARSFRVKRDSAGRWHIGFMLKPTAIDGPGDGSVLGVDRGVAVTLAMSDGRLINAPKVHSIRPAAKALNRAKPGSNRRVKTRTQFARAHARAFDQRRDFVEKITTGLARQYDLIRIEDLKIVNMIRSASGTKEIPGRSVAAKRALNRSIVAAAWGLFGRRLEDKAPGRVEKLPCHFTSQRCAVCGYTDRRNRKSQAFHCLSCGHEAHADLNAAENIAAGRVARGAGQYPAVKRRPQQTPPVA